MFLNRSFPGLFRKRRSSPLSPLEHSTGSIFFASTLETVMSSAAISPARSWDEPAGKVKDPPTHMRVLKTDGGGEGRGEEVEPSGDRDDSCA